eukprot:8632049-Heterocapsa_arctica.AAC.1
MMRMMMMRILTYSLLYHFWITCWITVGALVEHFGTTFGSLLEYFGPLLKHISYAFRLCSQLQ